MPPGVESFVLDRAIDGHRALADKPWDAVIDVSGYTPAVVRDALDHLAVPNRQWVYISSTSVFADTNEPMQNETTPVRMIVDPEVRAAANEDPTFDWRGRGLYGECKVLCEQEIRSRRPATILRPCVIAGSHDHTWRFPYWVERGRRSGPVLAPGPSDRAVAVIDVRDLARFAVDCAERPVDGTFVLAPRPQDTTFAHLLAAVGVDLDQAVLWADDEFLMRNGVEPWAGLPFWLPPSTNYDGMNSFDASAAYAAGFMPRPLAETAADVAAWLQKTDSDLLPDRGISLTAHREAELIESWRARTVGLGATHA